MKEQFYVYIMSNHKNGTLYVGVTSNLAVRVFAHKNELIEGFTKTYHLHSLVYYEVYEDAYSAITREKQLKKWRRDWKINLIEKMNPEWRDLY
ncbi:GIY-YIG nuclease family protein, partial [Candidatus Sordicultor fermentans]|uniref:GIY-YIG nuclease family protein n=1 Tax=Candidatus Sordicultor fermentans TaxID=1953203 RepID=UPI0039089084